MLVAVTRITKRAWPGVVIRSVGSFWVVKVATVGAVPAFDPVQLLPGELVTDGVPDTV